MKFLNPYFCNYCSVFNNYKRVKCKRIMEEPPIHDPHCLQCTSPLIDPPFHRILHPEARAMPYQRRQGEVKSVIHWGQRKLLLSEIEFLTICARDHGTDVHRCTVVYAGAAPGTHIDALSKMFPEAHFVLVDPAPFTVRPSRRIEIIQDMFTDDLARQLSRRPNVLFISDIRTADPNRDSLEESEARIKNDMSAQWQWHLLLGSLRSMLKFRLPWDKDQSRYLDGDVYLPVWGPTSTTEARLITSRDDPSATRVYDHELYEGQMYYHNTVMRPSKYNHFVRGEGLDRCYDCRAEVAILDAYIEDIGHFNPSYTDKYLEIARMSEWISRSIARDRTLASPNPDKDERVRAIKRRQLVNGVPAYERGSRR